MSDESSYLATRTVRRFIRYAGRRSLKGLVGQFLGRRVGWRMPGGCRIIIEDAREYIQKQVLLHGVYEPNIARVIAAILGPGDLFFDVGANIGNHTIIAANTGARVHAFEPVPRLAARIRANVLLNDFGDRVQVFENACGDAQGSAVIHVAERTDDGSHSLLAGISAKSTQHLAVPLTTLDQHVAEERCSLPLAIKIDVEGYEARVLDGSRRLLAGRTPPLLILETGDRLAEQIGESAQSVLGRLTALGFELIRLPEAGLVDPKLVAQITGELNNYLCLPPRFAKRSAVLAALGATAQASPC